MPLPICRPACPAAFRAGMGSGPRKRLILRDRGHHFADLGSAPIGAGDPRGQTSPAGSSDPPTSSARCCTGLRPGWRRPAHRHPCGGVRPPRGRVAHKPAATPGRSMTTPCAHEIGGRGSTDGHAARAASLVQGQSMDGHPKSSRSSAMERSAARFFRSETISFDGIAEAHRAGVASAR